ncbi:hypothetical protein SEA_SHAM_254 [Streptomyces phage Sham]|nr:hypothetical protein SEA_SHAM_254 [Streptomyces phage Sham]
MARTAPTMMIRAFQVLENAAVEAKKAWMDAEFLAPFDAEKVRECEKAYHAAAAESRKAYAEIQEYEKGDERLSTPNGHVIRFEIPEFGVTKFDPVYLSEVLADTNQWSSEEIVKELREMGFDLAVMANNPNRLTHLEWSAIYGECTGRGMD